MSAYGVEYRVYAHHPAVDETDETIFDTLEEALDYADQGADFWTKHNPEVIVTLTARTYREVAL